MKCFVFICGLLLFNTSLWAESLPKVYLTAQNLSTEYSNGTIRIDDGTEMLADVRYRGATSLQYQKKSFAIRLKDSEGNKVNAALLGMRSDNSWILDAMAADKARMRNRVSTDLWLDFSNKVYYANQEPQVVNGTRGKFVEVFLNDDYYGLFCLTEKIDRKQLKLKKCTSNAVRGELFKATGYGSMWIPDESRYAWDNNSNVWDEVWELQYPDTEEGEPIDWEPFVNTVRWLNTATDKEINERLADKTDVPVWTDYFLLVDLILADDNVAKNMYVSFYDLNQTDCRLTVTPWDMDATWGRNYKREPEDAETETPLYHQIYSRMINSTNAWSELFKPRYAELRKTYFSLPVLKSYFSRYFNLFGTTGAAQREIARWNEVDGIQLDFDAEELYIYDWIEQRLAILDQRYNYKDDADAINILAEEHASTYYPVYSIYGEIVGVVPEPTCERLRELQLKQGVYIVGNKKIVVKY